MADYPETLRPSARPLGEHLLKRPWQWRYSFALGVVTVGWMAREALTPLVGPTALPFIFFFPAVACAAWFGRAGPGVLAALLASVVTLWFFIEPVHSFIARDRELATILAFLISCAFIVGAIAAMHRARRDLMRVNRELAHARDSLATTLISIGDGVIVTDAQGRITFLNPEAERLTHWKNHEANGRPLAEIFRVIHAHTRAPVENPAAQALALGKAIGLANHTILIAKDGTETAIDDSAAPIRSEGGESLGVVLVFRDVTEQRKAQATRTQLAAIVENCGDAIFTKNVDGKIEAWNAGAERLFGYRAAEVMGRPVTALVPPEYLDEEHQILARMRQGLPSERVETVRLAKDGRRLEVSISVSPLRDREGNVTGASTIVHDIGQRKGAEAALMQAKERLVADLTGMQRLHELGTLLLRENDLAAMLHRVLDASVELLRAKKGIVQLYDPATQTLQVVALVGFTDDFLRGFAVVPVAKNYVSSVALKARQRVIVENYATDPVFAHLRAGAAPHGIVASQSTPLFASDGEVFGILSTHFDEPHRPSESELRLLDLYAQQAERVIDHHRAAEALRVAQEQLAEVNTDLENTVRKRTAELQATVNELESYSYSISHDLRAPLRAIQTYASILQSECSGELKPEGLEYLRRMAIAADRMDRLIQDVLVYSRISRNSTPLERVELGSFLAGLIESYPNLRDADAEIEIVNPLAAVRANPAGLTQCLSNLLGNAIKFARPGVRAQIRIWSETRDGRVDLCLRDNGIGIAPEEREKIFEMFYQADPRREGTGVGLAVVKKAAERMGGKIRVDSAPGEGSTFHLELEAA